MIGTDSSRARTLSRRAILATCFLPGVLQVIGLDQLQVVNNDQAQLPLPSLESPSSRGNFRDGSRGGIVNEHGTVSQRPRYLYQSLIIVAGQIAATNIFRR